MLQAGLAFLLLLGYKPVMGITNLSDGRKYKIVIDNNLPEHVLPVYLAYAGSKLVARQEFHSKHPNENFYAETITEELDAYQAAVDVWTELRQKNPTTADKKLDYLVSLNSAGYLEPFVMDEYRERFPQEYKKWISSNRAKLRKYRVWKNRQGDVPGDINLDTHVLVTPEAM